MPSSIVPITDSVQVWQLRAQWSYNGYQFSESSWSFVNFRDATWDGAGVYDLWASGPEALFCAMRPDAWQLEQVIVEDRHPQTLAPLVVGYLPAVRPDSLERGTPPQVSALLSWRTGNAGRSYRGRTYWGPVRDSEVDSDGFLGGATREAMYEFAQSMLFTFPATGGLADPQFVIVSRTHNGAPRVPPVFTRPEFHFEVRYVKTIRKRNRTPSI
jgi:hypothetical protein